MRISRSRYETFMDCPYKYHMMYNLGWTATIMAEPLRKGSAVHRFLESWYDNLEMPKEDRLRLAFEALNKSLAKTSAPAFIAGLTPQNEAKLVGDTEGLMYAYVNNYGPSEDIAIFASELRGEIPLPSGHILCFEVDQVVNYNDQLWLLESKTTWELGPRFLKKFELSHQNTVYTWGTSKLLGRLLSGVLLNAIRKPSPNAKEPKPAFHRDTYVITEPHIKKALTSFIHVANDIESRDKTNPSDWPQDTNRCHDYGGCPFWAHCAHSAPLEKGALFTQRGEDYVDNPAVKGYPPPRWEE